MVVDRARAGEACESGQPPTRRQVPGEPGVWLLLFGDLTLFALLFSVFLHERREQPMLFAESQQTLALGLGVTNTFILLTSSLLVVLANQAMRVEESRHYASRLIVGAIALGCCFVVLKGYEYHEKISAGITPATNHFFMYYFVLTGLHLVHLIVGIGVLVGLWVLSRTQLATKTRRAFFEGGACFWHLVDLLWIVIFPLLFLVR